MNGTAAGAMAAQESACPPPYLMEQVRGELVQLFAADFQALAARYVEACVQQVWMACMTCLAAPPQSLSSCSSDGVPVDNSTAVLQRISVEGALCGAPASRQDVSDSANTSGQDLVATYSSERPLPAGGVIDSSSTVAGLAASQDFEAERHNAELLATQFEALKETLRIREHIREGLEAAAKSGELKQAVVERGASADLCSGTQPQPVLQVEFPEFWEENATGTSSHFVMCDLTDRAPNAMQQVADLASVPGVVSEVANHELLRDAAGRVEDEAATVTAETSTADTDATAAVAGFASCEAASRCKNSSTLERFEVEDGDLCEDVEASRFHMVCQHEGQYFLQAGDQSIAGHYTFDEQHGELHDQKSGDLLGSFSCDPISTEPLQFRPSSMGGMVDMPCIRVEDSEIMYEIQKASNDGAIFVVPSLLNGAEYPSHDQIVEVMEDYRQDNTGGARGQLAVHPAAGQFLLDNALSDMRLRGVSAVDAVLDNTAAAGLDFETVNGYLSVPAVDDFERAIGRFRESLHRLRIIAMEGLPARGLTPDMCKRAESSHKVSLIYASAVPVQTCTNEGADADQEQFQRRIAEAMLTAQYYGALRLASRRRHVVTVFLMPLGLGIFNNTWESIATSISLAVEMLGDEERSRLDIRLLTSRGNPEESATLSRLLIVHRKLRPADSLPDTPTDGVLDAAFQTDLNKSIASSSCGDATIAALPEGSETRPSLEDASTAALPEIQVTSMSFEDSAADALAEDRPLDVSSEIPLNAAADVLLVPDQTADVLPDDAEKALQASSSSSSSSSGSTVHKSTSAGVLPVKPPDVAIGDMVQAPAYASVDASSTEAAMMATTEVQRPSCDTNDDADAQELSVEAELEALKQIIDSLARQLSRLDTEAEFAVATVDALAPAMGSADSACFGDPGLRSDYPVSARPLIGTSAVSKLALCSDEFLEEWQCFQDWLHGVVTAGADLLDKRDHFQRLAETLILNGSGPNAPASVDVCTTGEATASVIHATTASTVVQMVTDFGQEDEEW